MNSPNSPGSVIFTVHRLFVEIAGRANCFAIIVTTLPFSARTSLTRRSVAVEKKWQRSTCQAARQPPIATSEHFLLRPRTFGLTI
jgi:hypothetical protein